MPKMVIDEEACRKSYALGRWINSLRTEQGLSQSALAEIAGISRSHLCEIEKGGVAPSVFVVHKIAQALSVTIETLLGEGDKGISPSEQSEIIRLRRRLELIETIAAKGGRPE